MERQIYYGDSKGKDNGLRFSEERQTLAAIRGLSIEGLSVMDGIGPKIPGEVIHLGQDRAFSAFRDPENSDLDYSDVEEGENSSAI